ncbi:hypothetical protein VTO73DRAFT_10348 [Trametes versicolor]
MDTPSSKRALWPATGCLSCLHCKRARASLNFSELRTRGVPLKDAVEVIFVRRMIRAVLCSAITAVAAARPYHSSITPSRRRSCTSRHVPATRMCLSVHGAHGLILSPWDRPGDTSPPGVAAGLAARVVAHASVGQSIGIGRGRALSILSETYRHSGRRAHPWNDSSESALGHMKTTRTEILIAGEMESRWHDA